MVSTRAAVVALAVVALLFVGIAQPSVNDLPGFSDHTGPTEMDVIGFERLDSGCADEVADYASSRNGPNGTLERVTFVETGDPDANLSVSTMRTSSAGADLSTFRVEVNSHADDTTNASCTMGVQYRLELRTSGGSPQGFVPDAHGTRVLWITNGRIDSCSGSVTSPLELGCNRFLTDRPDRVWANVTA